MTPSKEHSSFLSYLQLFLFIVIIILVQYKQFYLGFALLIGFIIFFAIISKQKRVFLWIITAHLLGLLIYFYGDRIIDTLPYHVNTLMVLSRCLLIIPIVIMVYITKKFKEPVNHYWKRAKWKASISFPFIWNGFHSVSVQLFLIIALFINVAIFVPFIIQNQISLGLPVFLIIFLFSSINSILEEILWRGILLTRMVDLVGEKAGLLFSGLAFGFSHLIFGYSWIVCLGFAIGGFFYAGVTIRSGSIIPAIIWHFVFNILMLLSGAIPIIS